MENINLLFKNLPLLVEHAEVMLQYEPYYNCRVHTDHSWLKYLPLGPFMEFWKEVPVNTAGKILLTKNTFTNNYSPDPADAELLEESGFKHKHPVPGIAFNQLSGIMYRYMQQFQDQKYLIGVSLEQVIQELEESQPWEQRVSCGYQLLRDRVEETVANIAGTEQFSSRVVPAFVESSGQYYPKRYFYAPVFYHLQQQADLSFKLFLELQVPTRYPEGRGVKYINSGGAVAVADTMQAAYNCMEYELLQAGYTTLSAQVTLEKTGITGVFEKPFLLTETAEPAPGQAEALSVLLNRLKAILEKYMLWIEFYEALPLKAESPTKVKY